MSASQQKKLRQQQREQGIEKRQVAMKKAEKTAKKETIITTVVSIVVAVAIIAVLLFSSNLFYHAFSAVNIGGESYNASELSFFYKSDYYSYLNQYGDYLQYFGLDPTKPLSSQQYGEDETWADYFLDSAVTSMTEITALCTEAEKEGFKLSEEQLAKLDAELATLKDTAAAANYNSVNAYLAANYGKGCNEQLVRRLLEKSAIAQAYQELNYNSLTYSESDLNAHYEANKDNFDNYTYISYFADGAANEEEGIDSETAMANAKDLADSIIAGVTSEDEFAQSVADKTEGESSSVTTSGSSLNAAYADWIKDASRKAGDITVSESSNGYYAIMFLGREKNDSPTVSARHILTYVLPDENGNYSNEAKAEAKAKAEDILAQWKAGDATEESFAALANQYSEDPGSNTNGGLYESFSEGRMVKEFNDWCFDPVRKPGDTGIVFNEGDYCGYHIIYFVGQGDSNDKVLAENDLRSTDYQKWLETVTSGYTAEKTFMAKLIK